MAAFFILILVAEKAAIFSIRNFKQNRDGYSLGLFGGRRSCIWEQVNCSRIKIVAIHFLSKMSPAKYWCCRNVKLQTSSQKFSPTNLQCCKRQLAQEIAKARHFFFPNN
jgi:hypothetical protein